VRKKKKDKELFAQLFSLRPFLCPRYSIMNTTNVTNNQRGTINRDERKYRIPKLRLMPFLECPIGGTGIDAGTPSPSTGMTNRKSEMKCSIYE